MHDYVGQQLGSYRALRLLGKGATASVYLGEHIYLKSLATLKILHMQLSKQDSEQFLIEAQTLVGLSHPHIVRVHDFAVQDDIPFLVMTYAAGGTMRSRYPEGTRLPLDTVVFYVQQIASALQYAHDRRLIHRDIKPENMLLDAQENLLLSDFGLALFTPRADSYSSHTLAQHIAGTSLYLAPEQLEGRARAASDQYALAVVVYEWLCGSPPFTGTPLEIAVQHLSVPPAPLCSQLPAFPSALEEVIHHALAKEPEQRFGTVWEFAHALQLAYRASPSYASGAAAQEQETSPGIEKRRTKTTGLLSTGPIWNIPALLTSLVGREQEVAAICTLLTGPDVRLVTVLGTGGIGKTRLSLQVAVKMREAFVDGVCFVHLASISDPQQVMPAIAQELGIKDTSTTSILERMKSFLQEKRILLVLDNFEQVVTAASQVEELLKSCPRLRILITSRVVLHVQSEQEFHLTPLALPDLTQLVKPETLAQVPSVALFLQRARSVLSTFQLTAANAQAVAEICVRLDGLPLAIELAAARIKLLPPHALLARLSKRFEVLTSGMRTLPSRQQTLRNALKWSYDLLDASEQRLFRRLAVFVDGWTLEAVEAVCYYDRAQERDAALDEVASLLDKSLLLETSHEDEEPRLQMLMTVREYGLECLRESGEAEATQQTHALYYLALVEEAEQQQSGGEQALWLERLQQELDNLRAALHWLSKQPDTELSLRLSASLYWFWIVHGYFNEGQSWTEKALANSKGKATLARAKALKNAGGLAYSLQDFDRAEDRCQESLALFRQLDDAHGCAGALYWLGLVACWGKGNYAQAHAYADEALALNIAANDISNIADTLLIKAFAALNQGHYVEARQFMEQGLAHFRRANDSWGMAYTLQYLGQMQLEQGDYVQALTNAEESLNISTELGYTSGIAYALGLQGSIALKQGDVAMARSLIEESLSIHQERGQPSGIVESLFLLAKVTEAEGNYAEAQKMYEECFTQFRKLGERRSQIDCLERLGIVALKQGESARAVLLWGTAAQLRQEFGIPMSPIDQADYEQAETTARKHLGNQVFTSLWAQGRAMAPEQALATSEQDIKPFSAASLPTPVEMKRRTAAAYPDELTAREVEVLRLLAQGYSDAQIAEHLIISVRTVNTHVSSIYRKIQVTARAAATRYALEHHLA